MQGQTYRLWAACQEGPGLECKSTYCSCRYAGLTDPAPPQLSYATAGNCTVQTAHLMSLSVQCVCLSVCVCVCVCVCVSLSLCVCVRKYCFKFTCMCIFMYVHILTVLMFHALLRQRCHSACLLAWAGCGQQKLALQCRTDGLLSVCAQMGTVDL